MISSTALNYHNIDVGLPRQNVRLCVNTAARSRDDRWCGCLFVCVCVCSISYPACKAHAPYYIVICGLSICTIIFCIISKAARFSGNSYLKEHVYFDIFCNFLSHTSLILRRIQLDIINARVSSCEVHVVYSCINECRISSKNFTVSPCISIH